jgi:predicted acyltransferase
MFVWGAAGLAAGQLWSVWFPINKNLWTSSYVLFTAGFACIVFGLCYLLIDQRGIRRWAAPFLWYGMNPLFLFVASGLLAKMLGIWKVTVATSASASAAASVAAASASGQAVATATHTIALKTWLYQSFFAPLASPKTASLLFALAYVALWLAVAWLLHRRKIFIKL